MDTFSDCKEISNWAEIFDMVFELMTFLREVEDITPELVIKATYDLLKDTGYSCSLDAVEEEYYKCL
jgi:hypothetical protein